MCSNPILLGLGLLARGTTECSNSGFSENVSNVAIAITDKGCEGCSWICLTKTLIF